MNHGPGNLEKELRTALRREAAPQDFAAAILVKARAIQRPSQAGRQPQSWLRRPFTLALAAALAAVALIPSVALEYRYRENAKRLRAERDLLTALAITRDQLRQVRTKVERTVITVQ